LPIRLRLLFSFTCLFDVLKCFTWQPLHTCVITAARGRGRGRGRGRPLLAADDSPVVGLDANMTANSPNKPDESALTRPQRQGRGKASSQGALWTVGREPRVPETNKLDVLASTVAPPTEQRTDVSGQRVIEASNDSIVISFSNTDTDAVAPAVSISQKPPKIGSGRLGKTEAGSGRKSRGKRGRDHSARTAAAEEPVTIGIAVIKTNDQPDVQYKAVDQTPKLKGILKRTQLERHEDWVEEPVEKLDWDREIEEAQRRKDEMSSLEGSTATIENHSAGLAVKEKAAVKPSVISNDDVVDADDDDEWEDVEDDEASDEDVHDISAESFDKFIKEHTLKLDVALATPDVTEWTVKDPSGSITAGSQDSFLKTPVGQTRVVDWGAEMDQLSQGDKHRMSVELGE